MKAKPMTNLSRAIVLATMLTSPVAAQDAHVEVAKRSGAIPKRCQQVIPANIESTIDTPALVTEAICKGAGDMLADYTYTVNSLKREKDKQGKVKDETFVYEVFIPTLRSGMSTKGVLVVTSHNGVAVPPEELEKTRSKAAEKIEKEEERIARGKTGTEATSPEPDTSNGMRPLGMYARTTLSHSAFGVKTAGVTLAIADFLRACDLTFMRREQIAGRDTLIFRFTPRPGLQFSDDEKYMAELTGEVCIDAVDRIVTRLTGWPANIANPWPANAPDPWATKDSTVPFAGERLPAVYLEMMRLPQAGIWLPHVIHMNGADHQTLFDGIKTISTSIYSNYIRFSAEVKDAVVEPPKNP
jgi:hypothetical protein